MYRFNVSPIISNVFNLKKKYFEKAKVSQFLAKKNNKSKTIYAVIFYTICFLLSYQRY